MRGRSSARLLVWAERFLLITGSVLLAWYAIVTVQQYVTQYFAHESLVSMPGVEPAPITNPAARRPPPAVGTPLADLSIPRLHLSAVVLHGSDARTLRVGVGHIENTAFPGEAGNVAIAGHRDSFFRPLERVRVGDDVLLQTPQGRVRYRVASLRVVPPTDVSVLRPTRDATLTLVTCYPFWVFGHAPDRFIVSATRVEDTAPDSAAAEPAAPSVRAAVSTPTRQARAADSKPGRDVHDDVLVRQAIERFRGVYNARFVRVGEVRSGGPLTFDGCQIHVNGNRATAVCQTTVPGTGTVDVLERTFALENAGGVWSIRSFSMLP